MYRRYSTAASQGQTLREAAGGAGQCRGAGGSIWAAAGKIRRAIVARGLRAAASRRAQVVRASDYLRLAIFWQRSMAYHCNTDETRLQSWRAVAGLETRPPSAALPLRTGNTAGLETCATRRGANIRGGVIALALLLTGFGCGARPEASRDAQPTNRGRAGDGRGAHPARPGAGGGGAVLSGRRGGAVQDH